jgi:hypothetical protein
MVEILLFVLITVMMYIALSPRLMSRSVRVVKVPVPVRVAVPVNIPTQRIESYRQVGYLYNDDNVMMPIYGRKLHASSTRWNYYTKSDNNNYSISIPLHNKGRDCQSEYGCDELYDSDEISVPEFNGIFKVKLYKNQMRYIPFL